MIIGIDAGGTNTDGVLLKEGEIVRTEKISGSTGKRESIIKVIAGLLDKAGDGRVDRIVLGSTVILNAFLEKKVPSCKAILMPGPGLSPEFAKAGEENLVINGYIDHRGREVESVREEQFSDLKERGGNSDHFAVVAKFSPRNPDLEKKVGSYLSEERTTLGYQLGGELNYPLRSSSAVINTKSKPPFFEFKKDLRDKVKELKGHIPIYFLKSDGAMVSSEVASSIPSLTIKSGPAASIFGLWALTGEPEALAIDIGGTTTDIGIIEEGKVAQSGKLKIGGLESLFPSIEALDMPLGGDLPVSSNGEKISILGQRKGPAAAFGGNNPTVTDALHVLRIFEEGDRDRAIRSIKKLKGDDIEKISEKIVDKFTEKLCDKLTKLIEERGINKNNVKLLGGGVLSRYLMPGISERMNMDFQVPAYSEVAGALGCAVSRPSLETSLRIDSHRGLMIVNGEESKVEKGKRYGPEELKNLAKGKALEFARKMGGKTHDPDQVEILNMRFFNVVKGGRVLGQICDIKSQVKPGVMESLDFDFLRGREKC